MAKLGSSRGSIQVPCIEPSMSITTDGPLGGSVAMSVMLLAISMVRHAASLSGVLQKKFARVDLVTIPKLATSTVLKDSAGGMSEMAVSSSTVLNAKWLMPKGSTLTILLSFGLSYRAFK